MEVPFAEALEAALRSIPEGRVATCGAIARALGDVRAARAVATWIRDHPDVPGGHRAVRADGTRVRSEPRGRRPADTLRERRVPFGRFVNRLEGVPLLSRLRALQEDLATRVSVEDDFRGPEVVAGVDAAYEGDVAHAVAVSVDARLEPAEMSAATVPIGFPYIPSYLAFRELPAIEAAVRKMRRPPDILLVDGHGRLHPARFGVACHVGVVLDLPTIGVAKHPLEGRVGGTARDDARPVRIEGRTEGYAWTPPGRSTPLYVSPGHRVSAGSALAIVRRMTRHGSPEPLRVADALAKKRKDEEKRETGSEA
ncbi:MAG: endonuclease V [Methanobacteriota archaeon]